MSGVMGGSTWGEKWGEWRGVSGVVVGEQQVCDKRGKKDGFGREESVSPAQKNSKNHTIQIKERKRKN